VTLGEIDYHCSHLLEDKWRPVSYFVREIGLRNRVDHYRVALVLERLGNDGFVEIRQREGSSRRMYRWKRT